MNMNVYVRLRCQIDPGQTGSTRRKFLLKAMEAVTNRTALLINASPELKKDPDFAI